MKKVLFLLGLFTLCATVTFAQDRPRANAKVAKKPGGWRDDSLLWVKKPVGNATIKSPRDAASGQKGSQPTQDKLGNFEIQDVKAPNPNEDKLGNFEIQDVKSPTTNSNARAGGSTQKRVTKPRRPQTGGH
jgi:hypothetical protein